MGGASSTYGRNDKFVQQLKTGDNLGDLGVDERIILKWDIKNII
jgi:hypothetical protein